MKLEGDSFSAPGTVSARLALALGVALIMALAQAPAGGAPKTSKRVERLDYTATDGVKGIHTGLGPIIASVTFPGGSEDLASFTIEDASGVAVLVDVIQDDLVGTFCGSTNGSIAILPNYDVTLQMYAGRCMDGTPAAVTSGTAMATFTRSKRGQDIVQVHPYSAGQPRYLGKGDAGLIATGVFIPARYDGVLEILVEDASGTVVPFEVEQGSDSIGIGCGDGKVFVPAGDPAEIFLYQGVCSESGEPGVVTHGTITTTFHRN